MTLMEFTVDGMVYDFFVTVYSSVKPFVQQAYPIQPSVTAPISGNFHCLPPLKRVGLCPKCDVLTADLDMDYSISNDPSNQTKHQSLTNTSVLVLVTRESQ